MPVTAAAVSFCRFAENSELTARVARQPSKRINMRQAQNMMGAVAFARRIGTPLNAHATIHWVGKSVTIPMVDASRKYVKVSTSGSSVMAFLAD
jgi:hypothetical protein